MVNTKNHRNLKESQDLVRKTDLGKCVFFVDKTLFIRFTTVYEHCYFNHLHDFFENTLENRLVLRGFSDKLVSMIRKETFNPSSSRVSS